MKSTIDGLAALRSSVKLFLKPGSLAMCHSTNQGCPSSCSSRHDYIKDPWQCLKDVGKHSSSDEKGSLAQLTKYASSHHESFSSRNVGHLQTRAIQIHVAPSQGSTESRQSQSSSDCCAKDDSGEPQPANSAPAGMLGCHTPDYMVALYEIFMLASHHSVPVALGPCHATAA